MEDTKLKPNKVIVQQALLFGVICVLVNAFLRSSATNQPYSSHLFSWWSLISLVFLTSIMAGFLYFETRWKNKKHKK